MTGTKIINGKDLKELASQLADDDIVVIERVDEYGDTIDLCGISVDVIDDIQLTDGQVVREVRLVEEYEIPTPENSTYKDSFMELVGQLLPEPHKQLAVDCYSEVFMQQNMSYLKEQFRKINSLEEALAMGIDWSRGNSEEFDFWSELHDWSCKKVKKIADLPQIPELMLAQ